MPAGTVIEKREIVRLVKKYKKDGGHKNTKSVWFSLKDLTKIIGLVSNLDNTPTNREGDGVRVYFAKYTKNYSTRKKEKNTILFIPTYNINGGAIHYDFMTEEETRELSEDIGDPDTDTDTKEFNDEGFNHGQLCPDICDGATIGGNV
jgi:predicted DNA binding protein